VCGYGFVDLDGVGAAWLLFCKISKKVERTIALRPASVEFGCLGQREIGRRAVNGQTNASVTPADCAVEIEKSEMQPGGRHDANRGLGRGR
jgi:hypothetical protein